MTSKSTAFSLYFLIRSNVRRLVFYFPPEINSRFLLSDKVMRLMFTASFFLSFILKFRPRY